MRKKNILVFLLTFYLLPSLLFSENINIKQDGHKIIYFNIKNKNNETLYYTIYSVGGFKSIIFQYSQIKLQPGENRDIKVIISPSIPPGIYEIELVAESRLDRISKNLNINILSEKIEKVVKPTEFIFNNKLINLDFNISENHRLMLEIYKDNKLLHKFEKEITPSNSEFIQTLNLGVGEYKAKLRLYKGTNLIYSQEKNYSRASYLTQKEEKWNYLMIYGTRIFFHNGGNTTERKTFTLYISKSQDPFFSTYDYKEKVDLGNNYKYIWEFVLLPGQSYYIHYSYNYSVILILILAAIFLVVMLYLLMKKDLKLNKYFMKKVFEIKEGKEIKICLEVVNKTKNVIYHIILEEIIPPIFELKKDFQVINPKKIMESKDEKKIIWEIPRIEPKETRIFTYKIVPKIGVKGKYSFPLAKIKYKKDNLTKIIFSNSLNIK